MRARRRADFLPHFPLSRYVKFPRCGDFLASQSAFGGNLLPKRTRVRSGAASSDFCIVSMTQAAQHEANRINPVKRRLASIASRCWLSSGLQNNDVDVD